jgi:hypothetical protein
MSLDIYDIWSKLVKKHTIGGACNFQDAACELAALVAATEREACAKVCEEYDACDPKYIAMNIRARK